jgi:hypothetical protein
MERTADRSGTWRAENWQQGERPMHVDVVRAGHISERNVRLGPLPAQPNTGFLAATTGRSAKVVS